MKVLWIPYEHKVLSFVDNMLIPVPVNITTVNKIFRISLKDETAIHNWLDKNTEKIDNPKNSEGASLARVGKVLYEKYKKGTEKLKDIYFVGRLENYKYFNMNQAFKNALDIFNNIEQ